MPVRLTAGRNLLNEIQLYKLHYLEIPCYRSLEALDDGALAYF